MGGAVRVSRLGSCLGLAPGFGAGSRDDVFTRELADAESQFER